MADPIASSMDQLSLNAKNIDSSAFDTRLAAEEDGSIDDLQPRKRTRQNTDDLLAELESEYMAPSAEFSPRWLNHLQKCVFNPVCSDVRLEGGFG